MKKLNPDSNISDAAGDPPDSMTLSPMVTEEYADYRMRQGLKKIGRKVKRFIPGKKGKNKPTF